MINLVLVDDDPNIHKLFKFHLKDDIGIEIDYIEDYFKAMATFNNQSYDLYVIDYRIGSYSGLDLLKILQKEERIYNRVILISGRIDEKSRIEAFKYGVSNIIDKPINFKILKSIIHRNIRMIESSVKEIYRVGSIALNHSTRVCEIRNENEITEIELTPIEFNILLKLIKNPGHVYSKNELSFLGKSGDEPMSYKSLEMKVVSIRKKLGVCGHMLKTVRGHGYRLG